MVDAVVQSVIQKVGSDLLDEGTRIVQLSDKIRSVQGTMRNLESYLKDAESKEANSPAVRNLIISIRDLAQDIEDLLDTYFSEIEPENTKGLFGSLKVRASGILHFMAARKLIKQIDEISTRASNKLEETKGIDLKAESDIGSGFDVEVWSERRKFLIAGHEPDEIFGRERIIENLKNNVLDKDTKSCSVISIVGPGGVGKTTVARKVFEETKGEFKYHAMVHVSKDPNPDDILHDIARKVLLNLREDEMNDNLANELYQYLKDKKYLIFLDDIWSKRTWDQLKDTLMMKSGNGSRIIVTSRYKLVGGYIVETARYKGSESFPYTLDILSENDAKEFFKRMISPKYEEEIRKPVKEIGDKIVERCGGLPLAIEVVVGMLRGRKRTAPAWDEVLGKMSQIRDNDCLKILALSYKDLPPELKPLFLYLGIFPENYEIFVPQLIPLWVAEKFIRVDGKQDEYVENKINELSSRNLLHVCSKKADGRARSCRIHSLVHDLCRRLAEDNNYFCTRNNLKSSQLAPMVRRLTTNSSYLDKNAFQDVSIPKIRAMFCFNKDKELFGFLKENAREFKFLRLLIIEFDDGKLKVPEEIAHLSGLIYLKMKGDLSEVPEGISRLKRLKTLEIRSKDVPEGILKMKHVKHLFLSSLIVVKKSQNSACSKSRDIDDEVDVDLPKLESLDIDLGPKFSITPCSVKKLTNLKRLGIYVTKKKLLDVLFSAEPALPNLQDLKLKLYVSFLGEIPELNLYHYHTLKKLNLYFDIAHEITGRVTFPRNLVHISLKMVTKIEDLMHKLKKLRNLETLKLKMCRAKGLDFSGEGSFPKLHLLMLKSTAIKGSLLLDEQYGLPKLDRFIYEPAPLSSSNQIPERLFKLMEKDDEEI